MNLRALYSRRFSSDDLRWKGAVWRILDLGRGSVNQMFLEGTTLVSA
jgi:hypothetical protein